MSGSNSYRQILRSLSIIGGASVINILVGLLRIKVAALLLGPAGVGLIGLFSNLISTGAGIAGLGFGNVGTRQIAQAAASDSVRVATARRALFWGTLSLAVLGGTAFWALRNVLADRVMGEPALANDIGWLSLAVALSIASASQNALLNGLRRIGDIARVSIASAILSTLAGIGALWAWGHDGIVIYVIAGPLASFVFGHWYVSRLPRMNARRQRFGDMAVEWKVLASLGFAFMVAGLAGTAGQLLVRLLVQRELGTEALGHFHAAWAISMTYIGFVLGAMGTDYYPRLAAVIHDHVAVNRLVNEQMEVALLLSAPILLAMLGLAPWVIELLYTNQFGEAVEVLRWQVLGDVLKIASWPLGFILVAAGAGKTFVATEWLAMGSFVALTVVLLPVTGLPATGISFLGMYVIYLFAVFVLARRRTGFHFNAHSLGLLCTVGAASGVVAAMARISDLISAAAGIAGASAFAVYALVRLAHAGNIGGPAGRLAVWARNGFQRFGVWRGN